MEGNGNGKTAEAYLASPEFSGQKEPETIRGNKFDEILDLVGSADLRRYYSYQDIHLGFEEAEFYAKLGAANGHPVNSPASLAGIDLSGGPCVVRYNDRQLLAIYRDGQFFRVPRPKIEDGKVTPRNDGQAFFWHLLNDESVKTLIGHGPAGVGKSLLAFAYAFDSMEKGRYSQVVILKQACEIGPQMGFLPGELDNKFNPYQQSVMDNMPLLVSQYPKIFDLIIGPDEDNDDDDDERPRVVICPFTHLRGRKFHRTLMVVDELQNTTYKQAYAAMTRLAGEDSKFVGLGDLSQVDYEEANFLEGNGLYALLEDFSGERGFAQVGMLKNEQSKQCELATKKLAARHAKIARIRHSS